MRALLALALCLGLVGSSQADSPVQVILTSGATWTSPAGYSVIATIEALGGGTNGGGAYAEKAGVSIAPGTVIATQVGAGAAFNGTASDTCFNGCSYLKAKGASGATGGQASASVGDTKYNGGNGTGPGNTGGGGAAGLHGAGNNASGNAGGSGDAGFGGAGGMASGQVGGTGTEWGAAGSGGGAGGAAPAFVSGGPYGGGCDWNSARSGYQGVIVITYRPNRRTSGGAF